MSRLDTNGTQKNPAMVEKILLKDILFHKAKIERLAGEIHRVYPSFKKADFVRDAVEKFSALELKARITWIAECLRRYLPNDYKQAVQILIRALPSPSNPNLSDDDFGEFIYAPYGEYVARYGCVEKHLIFSLDALHEITQRFSAEDAIRYFINAFPKQTLATLLKWSGDPHYHVRRLTSEGTRPKLPWSQKINIPITAPLSILEGLFFDPTRFVTRSVANHVNDISRVDPDLAIHTLEKWKKSGKQKQKEMNYLISHALRTLVKQGNPKAMRMLGFSCEPQLTLSKFIVPQKVKMNSPLRFSFIVTPRENARVVIDYTLYFQNKAGELKNKKVFKMANLTLKKNTPVLLSKNHTLREHMTTRRLYPGKHAIEIQINGKKWPKKTFLLNHH